MKFKRGFAILSDRSDLLSRRIHCSRIILHRSLNLNSNPNFQQISRPAFISKVLALTPQLRMLEVATLLRFAGPMFFIGLQGSTLYTAYKIFQVQNVGSLSPLTFISLFTNCTIWSLYGFFRNDNTVFIPNLSGALVASICVYVFHIFAEEKPVKLYALHALPLLIAGSLAMTNQMTSLGMLGCILSVLVSGSPLAVFKTVIKEKSTKSLPLGTSVILWVNSLSWMTYGLVVANDPFIYGPNILGFLLACVQMSLFAIYGVSPDEHLKLQSKV